MSETKKNVAPKYEEKYLKTQNKFSYRGFEKAIAYICELKCTTIHNIYTDIRQMRYHVKHIYRYTSAFHHIMKRAREGGGQRFEEASIIGIGNIHESPCHESSQPHPNHDPNLTLYIKPYADFLP